LWAPKIHKGRHKACPYEREILPKTIAIVRIFMKEDATKKHTSNQQLPIPPCTLQPDHVNTGLVAYYNPISLGPIFRFWPKTAAEEKPTRLAPLNLPQPLSDPPKRKRLSWTFHGEPPAKKPKFETTWKLPKPPTATSTQKKPYHQTLPHNTTIKPR
jgi:hypothetical protein